MNCLNFAFSSGKEHCQLRFSPPQIELVDKPEKRQRVYLVCRENISIIKTILVGWREGKWSPTSYTYYHENLDDSNRCFVRLYKLYMSLCPADCAVDLIWCLYKLHLLPAGIPASHFDTMNSASQLKYQGTRPNLLSQVIAATWLYDSEIDKQLVMETTRHSSTEGARTYTRTSETQHQAVSDMQCKEDMHSTPYPSQKPQSSKFVLIQGRSSTAEFSNITSTIIPASFAFHSCSSVTININSHTYCI